MKPHSMLPEYCVYWVGAEACNSPLITHPSLCTEQAATFPGDWVNILTSAVAFITSHELCHQLWSHGLLRFLNKRLLVWECM